MAKSSQDAEFCWDISGQARVGDGDGSKICQESDLRRNGTGDYIVAQPQDVWKKEGMIGEKELDAGVIRAHTLS